MVSVFFSGTGGFQFSVESFLRLSGYFKWYFFLSGTGERREFIIRCIELFGFRDFGYFSYDDFKFFKRVIGLLRGYDYKFLEFYYRYIFSEFDDEFYFNFESMYSYLRKRYRVQFLKQDFYLIFRTQDRFMCRIEVGIVGELIILDMSYRITYVKVC